MEIRVKIKSEEEIKQYKSYYNCGTYHNNTEWLFIYDMFKFCDKVFIIKSNKKINDKDSYKLFDENGKEIHYEWQTWMFHILPNIDENENYLLEF